MLKYLATVQLARLKSRMILSKCLAPVKKFVAREDGPTMTEYAIMVAVIAIVAMASAKTLGTEIGAVFSYISTQLASVT